MSRLEEIAVLSGHAPSIKSEIRKGVRLATYVTVK